MDWTEIQISIPVKELETASAIALRAIPYGIYIEDYSQLEQEVLEVAHIDLIDEELQQRSKDTAIIHLYIAPEENPSEAVEFLTARLNAENIPYTMNAASVSDEDWLNGWKKYYKSMLIGKRLVIHPVWEPPYEQNEGEQRVVLEMEPGLAFGSGTHETTRLCLELLEQYLTPCDNVLDIGCGSGILAIAALLLGASGAVGVDIDPTAVKTAKENAGINRVSDRFISIVGNLVSNISGRYSIILSNIVADVIIELSASIPDYLLPGGRWIISGIIEERLDEVKAALGQRFHEIACIIERGWAAAVYEN